MPLDLEFVTIPAGPFLMGSRSGRGLASEPDETPQHTLTLPAFRIMRFPVTNAQYAAFVDAAGHRPPRFWRDGRPLAGGMDHPVVGVNFHDAIAFCRWAAGELSLPVRLATEAEWEKASRGDDGRAYPWGDRWEPGRCNSEEARRRGTTPVAAFSPGGDSSYGVGDTVGNVSEWTFSMFSSYPYRPDDGRESYTLPDGARLAWGTNWGLTITNEPSRLKGMEQRSIRGGSWRQDRSVCRCAYRSWAAALHLSEDTGFRCACDV